MKKLKLDAEEQRLLEAYEAGEFESVLTDDRRVLLTQCDFTAPTSAEDQAWLADAPQGNELI